MGFRPYDEARDKVAAHRIWRETGWLEAGKKSHEEATDLFIGCGRALVADVNDEAECLVLTAPGDIRYLEEDLPFSCVTAVTTSRIARKQGFAKKLTAAAVAADGGKGTKAIFVGGNSPAFCHRYGIREGRLLSSFKFEKEYPCDLTWDQRNKILWTGAFENKLFGHDTAGSMMAHFWTPSTYNRGLSYYGEYLWVSSSTTKYIYKIHCPSDISAAPSSVGKIKSLFF